MARPCIFGCDTSGVPMHGFPNSKKRPNILEEWLSVIPRKLPADDHRLKYLKVCDYHFKLEHKTRGHHLTVNAIPSLYLKGVPKLSSDFDREHSYCLQGHTLYVPPTSTVQQVTDIPSTSHECVQPVLLSTSPEPSEISGSLVLNVPEVCVLPVIPKSVCVSTDIPCDPSECCASTDIHYDSTDICWDMSEVCASVDIPYDGPDVCASPVIPCDEPHSCVSMSSVTEPTQRICQAPANIPQPKRIKDYQREIINLKKKIKRMKIKEESLKIRLASVSKIAQSAIKISNNMTEEVRIFTQMQCREAGKKTNGRRFSEEEKILALSLMKKNPAGYSVLSEYFCLPSLKTLRPRLQQINKQSDSKPIGEKSSVIYDAFVTA